MSVDLYTDAFFKKRPSYARRAKVMLGSIVEMYSPSSYIDCGAALGDLVQEGLNLGMESYGIEGTTDCFPYLQCPQQNMLILDLGKFFYMDMFFDVLTCFEVAEHIEEEYVEMFIDNLCRLSNNLVISACNYGPTTKIHPTVKPYEWWIEKFGRRGFVQDLDAEVKLKELWDSIRGWPAVKEAYRNLIIFKR